MCIFYTILDIFSIHSFGGRFSIHFGRKGAHGLTRARDRPPHQPLAGSHGPRPSPSGTRNYRPRRLPLGSALRKSTKNTQRYATQGGEPHDQQTAPGQATTHRGTQTDQPEPGAPVDRPTQTRGARAQKSRAHKVGPQLYLAKGYTNGAARLGMGAAET